MKDILFVQRNWKMDFFEPISAGLTAQEKGEVRYEMGKEVEWMVRRSQDSGGSTLEGSLRLRISKLERLVNIHDDPSRFDQFYNYRRALFEYVLT